MQCKCFGRRRNKQSCRTTRARPQALAVHLLYCRRRRGCASILETCSNLELDKKNFIRVAPHLLKKFLNFATSLLRKPRKGNNDNSPGSLSDVFFFCVSGYSHKKSDPGNVTFGVASCIFFVCPFDNCLIIRRCCGGDESERFVLSSDSDVQCPSE